MDSTDAIDASEREFGLDRLVEVASAYRLYSAQTIVQMIREAVANFVGETPQFDDLTLVVIKRED